MGAIAFSLAVVIASAILASAIIYSARTIATAIAQQPPDGRANSAFPLSPNQVPHSAAGFPVEPSGIPVELETPLDVGSTVLAFSQGRWWRAKVTALEGEEHVRLHYPGWDSYWDESRPRSELQVDFCVDTDDERPYQGER
jgi:hypothetical protein